MGLTIHYQLHSHAPTLEHCQREIAALHAYAEKLAFDDVGPITVYDGAETDFRSANVDDSLTQWFLSQSRKLVTDPGGERVLRFISAETIIGFTVRPTKGSEPANFALARYQPCVEVEDNRTSTGLHDWQWGSFCKTQYASRYGVENFLRAHIGVIRMLDEAKRLGILHHVSDEGGYWGRRDTATLVKTVDGWNEMVAGFVGTFDDLLPEAYKSEAPIKRAADYEHLEARGRNKRRRHDRPGET